MAETSIGGDNVRFQATLWTTVVRARDAGGEEARAAMGRLVERYWKPLYFFARRRGLDVERAKDAAQGFFERVLDRDFLSGVAPEKGRFRSWLLAAMSHFLSDEREREMASKRGGGRVVSLDVETAERQLAGAGDTPERLFMRAWATETMARSMARLGAEWRDRGYDTLVRHLSGEAGSIKQSAEELGVAEHDVKNRLHAMRVRLRELLREEVAESVENPALVDEELAALFEALGK
jgi:RNA polymerase sigma-70 factor (ECF subfamily)